MIPDGCMDLVRSPREGLQVAGPSTTAFIARMAASSDAVGVRLLPGAALEEAVAAAL